ncbi:MAG: APC family permease [Candidatus Aminicenantes bacterium]|nr:APC family permease [Candidatus Aminicenantes bacterium]
MTPFLERAKKALLGGEKDIRDPRIFHKLALVAFFAWVGLGADGLSSSCYGPQEAFLSLGDHKHLALYLAVLTAITVFTISASYSQIIELFPTGGGGYLVATKLLGPAFGLISGCALLVDYMLTISISIASGAEAVLSFLPPGFFRYKLEFILFVAVILILINLRGVKESVAMLTPIFLLFFISHVFVIVYGIFTHVSATPTLIVDTVRETRTGIQTLGLGAMAFLLLRAYSFGAGTYTGIEAVSNGLQILREPRVRTGRKTMMYMATSLAFTAGGLLICYLLTNVQHVAGKTLNASLLETLLGRWTLGGFPLGVWLVGIILVSEGAILFVAAQSGFIDGPRVLGNMAIDSWVPNRFMHLSERLVVQNGIIFMGGAAMLILIFTKGSVQFLVVMYSINVFLTFTLSQLGMCLHWLKTPAEQRGRKFAVNLVGLLMSVSILAVTTTIKFKEGGWITLTITSGFVVVALFVKRHYRRVRGLMRRLDDIMAQVQRMTGRHEVAARDEGAPTAVLFVRNFGGLGIHSFLNIHRTFPGYFKNFVFISVGVVDWKNFKGAEEVRNLEGFIMGELKKYVSLANRFGFYAESVHSIELDTLSAVQAECEKIQRRYNKAVFFVGKLVFEEENIFTKFLHNQTALSIQRLLQFRGIPTIIMPIRVLKPAK